MTEKETTSGLKVSRPRRRLYDPLPEPPEKLAPLPAVERPGDAALETVTVPLSMPPGPEAVVRRFARMAMGTALLPFPIVDFVAGSAVQLKMIKALAALYRVEFSVERTRAIVGALIGGFHIGLLTGSLFKWVPVIGLAGGVISSAAISFGITYALGTLFIRHFEAGGTLLDFNLQKARQAFPAAYAQGREKAGPVSRP